MIRFGGEQSRVAVGADPEERACLGLPRELRELVDGADDERRALLVDVLVDHVERQAVAEVARLGQGSKNLTVPSDSV